MKVQGRDCTLTVAKDNEYYPLPYSEETVRQTSKGYSLLDILIYKKKINYSNTPDGLKIYINNISDSLLNRINQNMEKLHIKKVSLTDTYA